MLQLFAGKIRNLEISVSIEGGEDIQIYGIIGQVSQILVNLMSNAIQAVPVGGKIWFDARHEGDGTEITVRDTGHGMTDEVVRDLFEPFYSTKGDLGNGLGLYVSPRL